jgi:uncharacterized protein
MSTDGPVAPPRNRRPRRDGPRSSDGGQQDNTPRIPLTAEEAGVLKELIKSIAMELVDNPDQVEVSDVPGDHNSLIELRVAKEDIGKVIGKEGRTAQSMRTLLSAVSTKMGRRAHLDIVD